MRSGSARDRLVWAACLAGLMQVVALCPPAVAQSGINLSWDDCGAFGSESKTFACDTNAGSVAMVGSFAATLPPGVMAAAWEMILDLQSAGTVLPDWWMFAGAGSCRTSALQASFDFTSGLASCGDYFGGVTIGGISYQAGFGAANRARVQLVTLDPAGGTAVQPPVPGVEYYMFKLTILFDKTVGSGSCEGCGEGVCIVLNEVRFVDLSQNDVILTAPLLRNHVTWQGGIPDCPAATPVRNRTWGAVKSLYRP